MTAAVRCIVDKRGPLRHSCLEIHICWNAHRAAPPAEKP